MWTPTTRLEHSRDHLRYGSDLSDAEWEIIAPFPPPPGKTGRPRRWPMRKIMNAIFYVLRSGCPWRMVPDGFAPATTVYRWFVRLRDEGMFETINHHLLWRDRERVGRQASPSAAVFDSQSVKTSEAGGPRGYDAGKKVKGRKRHAMVDTDGRALSTPQRQLRSTHQRPIVRGPVSGFVPERKFKFEHLRKLAATGWIHFCNNAVFRFTVVSEGKLRCGPSTINGSKPPSNAPCSNR